jgi:hypothetical protein
MLFQMQGKWSYVIVGIVGLALAVLAPRPAPAAKLKTILRAVLIPEEAQHYEDLARRRGRPEEERYWGGYRAGLEEQRHERGIGPDEARRYEELSRREHHRDEERYWRDYRAGFGRDRPHEPPPYEERRRY